MNRLRQQKNNLTMPFYPSPIPAPIFDSDESDEASQQSNDSSSYLSSQFSQHTRLSYSPQIHMKTTIDDSITSQDDDPISTQSTPLNIRNKKRKRSNCDKSQDVSIQTPNQSPYTRRKNLDYVQEKTFQSPKIQRRSRHHDDENEESSSSSSSNLVNVNPFSPETSSHRYPTRLVAKRSLRQLIISRYEKEFFHQSFINSGEYSHVNLCTNRLDGLNYAIKTSKQSIIGTCYERIAWREICAYAILKSHENLVQYYSGWIEIDGRFFIQLEYCNRGCLDDLIEKNRQNNICFNEQQLKILLHQMSDVLTYMHEKDLAHMDIKPSNIMLCQYSTDDETNTVYKLTDLGHISQISLGQIDEDGDSRYLALEILQKNIHMKKLSLDKCDIFSLGLTLYVCATNSYLPKQGNEWQQLRLHILQYLHFINQCSNEFNYFLREKMCNIDPNQRPSACQILIDPIANPIIPTSRESLQHSLKQEREKNLLLNKKLLDQYLLTVSSDLQILPNDINNSNNQFQLDYHSPNQSLPNDHSPNTPICSINTNQSITSPSHCGSMAFKQQVKLAGSNMFRYYSSII